MGKIIGGTLAAALFLCVASWTHAGLVTYTFQDVVFQDGGTLSGFFTLDPALTYDQAGGTPFDFDFKTAGGTRGLTPFEYTPASTMLTRYFFEQGLGLLFVSDDLVGTHGIDVNLLSPNGLSSGLIGTIPMDVPHPPQGSIEFNNFDPASNKPQLFRYVTSGNAIGVVPEPGSYGLMLVGLMLVAGRFRQRFSI